MNDSQHLINVAPTDDEREAMEALIREARRPQGAFAQANLVRPLADALEATLRAESTDRDGCALAEAVERGDDLSLVEQLRVVVASKNAQIARLVEARTKTDEDDRERTCAICGRDDIVAEDMPFDDNGTAWEDRGGNVICTRCDPTKPSGASDYMHRADALTRLLAAKKRAILAIHDDIVRNKGRADAAILAGLEALADGA